MKVGHDLDQRNGARVWIICGFWGYELKSDSQDNEKRVWCWPHCWNKRQKDRWQELRQTEERGKKDKNKILPGPEREVCWLRQVNFESGRAVQENYLTSIFSRLLINRFSFILDINTEVKTVHTVPPLSQNEQQHYENK